MTTEKKKNQVSILREVEANDNREKNNQVSILVRCSIPISKTDLSKATWMVSLCINLFTW